MMPTPESASQAAAVATKLRVLHVVGGYPGPSTPSSMISVKTQIESLSQVGIDCDVLILRGIKSWKYLTGWWQVRTRLRRRRYDLLHAHYGYCGAAVVNHGLPAVTSFMGSDLYGKTYSDGRHMALSHFFHGWLSRYVARRCAATIVKSLRMCNDLGLEVHVLPNGVDLKRFRPAQAAERQALRQQLGFSDGVRYVLFVSNPAKKVKRYWLAERAVSHCRGIIAAPVELLAVHGQPQDIVQRHMRACDALLLTSSHEGSPNVIKEAMASNMRIVSVDVGDVRERLVGIAGCRVVDQDSPEQLGEALAEVLDDPEPPGSREAVKPLSLAAVAASLRAIYEGCMESA